MRGATRVGGDARRMAAETTARVREVRDRGGGQPPSPILSLTRAPSPEPCAPSSPELRASNPKPQAPKPESRVPSPEPMHVAVARLRGRQCLCQRGGAARRRQAAARARRHRAAVRRRVHGGERARAHSGPARRGGEAARAEAVDGLRRQGVEIGPRCAQRGALPSYSSPSLSPSPSPSLHVYVPRPRPGGKARDGPRQADALVLAAGRAERGAGHRPPRLLADQGADQRQARRARRAQGQRGAALQVL